MCGIFGYIGKRNCSQLLINGLKRLEYRGYDSVGKISKNLLRTKSSPFEEFKNSAKISNKLKMNILNLIKFKDYYCIIDENFQKSLLNKVKNKKEIYNKLKISHQTLERILNKKNYWVNIQNYFDLCNLLDIPKEESIKNMIKIKTKNSFPIEFKDIQVSESLFRIIGHILGDGGIHVIKNEGKYRVFYVNNEELLLNSFSKDIKKLFNAKIYFRKREKHGDEIWLPSTVGYLFYKILDYENLKEKRIPLFIFKSNEKLICSLIQAIYDDEGFLYPNKHMIIISLLNKNLLEDIKKLLDIVGIKSNNILIHKSKNRSLMYYFSITGKNNILDFYNKINFLHPIKRNKLEILKNKYGE